jgi:gas vesicle protein
MTTHTNDHRDYRLAIGFLAGTAVGAGLMMWFAPRAAAEIRRRVTDTAAGLGNRAQAVRDGVADGVVRGAQHVERMANAAKSSA